MWHDGDFLGNEVKTEIRSVDHGHELIPSTPGRVASTFWSHGATTVLLFMLLVVAANKAAAQTVCFDGGILIEHPHPEYSDGGTWTTSKNDGHSDGDKRESKETSAWAMWRPELTAGEYRVYYWDAGTKGTFEITHAGGTAKVPSKGGFTGWMSLGDYTFAKGNDGYVKALAGEKGLKVDAVKFLPSATARRYQLPPYPPADGKVPYLEPKGRAANLILGGKPYLIIANETHDKMTCVDKNIVAFDDLLDSYRRQGVNTLEAPIAWGQIEPEEGTFNFAAIDALIEKARERNMHLAILWFGSYKNLQSYYAPGWAHKKFPKKTKNLEKNGKISDKAFLPFGADASDADAKAFAKLMARIKEKDPKHQVVLLMQVQNEMPCVITKETLDAHPEAQAAFDAPVPEEIITMLVANKTTGKISKNILDAWLKNGAKTSGSWPEVFGNGQANRLIGAYYFGKYTEKVAAAGKAVLPLPMYCNSWVGESACDEKYMDIFHLAAPSIDGMGPDNGGESGYAYVRDWNTYLCAEGAGPEDLWSIYGNLDGLFGAVYWVTDPGYTGCDTTNALLAQMGPLICAKKGSGEMLGFQYPREAKTTGSTWQKELGPLKLTFITTTDRAGWNGRTSTAVENSGIDGGDLGTGCGLVMKMGDGDYVITAHRVDVELRGLGAVSSAEIGHFVDGVWTKEGAAKIATSDGATRLSFPTEKRQYAQVRVRFGH
jgi:Beta-galactosidase/Domain of unknown function (DUF5597)